ncbi:lipopolysaccharide assembly protein LapA domain-containing protein [Elusimicrobiota bacterium]
MQIVEIIVTLVIAGMFILLGVYNSMPVTIDLLGFRSITLPTSVFMFALFLAGATYVAFWSIAGRVRNFMAVKDLKKRVRELEDARYKPAFAPTRTDAGDEAVEPKDAEAVAKDDIDTQERPVTGEQALPEESKEDLKLAAKRIAEKMDDETDDDGLTMCAIAEKFQKITDFNNWMGKKTKKADEPPEVSKTHKTEV